MDGNEGVAKRVERLLRNESGGEAAIGGDIKMIFRAKIAKNLFGAFGGFEKFSLMPLNFLTIR